MTGIKSLNLHQRAAALRHAFTSWHAFREFAEVDETELDHHSHPGSDVRWSNEDLDPTPREKRTWNWVNFVNFYVGLSFGNWTLGSTMTGIGLNWWRSILVIFASQMISSVAMFLNSRCASTYHIGYPMVARSIFGMWGSFYVVGARAALAILWYGIQLYSGSSFLAIILRCIFGGGFSDIPNHIPESMGITSSRMLAFFLFWLLHLCLTPFRPYQLRPFFWLKVIVIMPAIFGLFIFCMVNTKANLSTVIDGTQDGSRAWFIIYAINAGMGNTATLITNQPDISRWSKTKSASMWSQLIANPIAVTLSASLGILATAAINNSWGTALWNPWDLLSAILDRYWSAGTRTAVFFSAATWALSILGTNIAANMIPFGSDASMIFPRYITIPRGQFIVNCLAFAVCPWKILASATVFTTFLSGYGLFMSSVASVMICDYWLMTNGNVFISNLYDPTRNNRHYYYCKGWNIQAYLAYIAGIALPFAGFVGTLGPTVSSTATKMGDLGWCLSFVTTFVVYYVLCRVWPTENQKMIRAKGLKWEEMESDEIVAIDGTTLGESGTTVHARPETVVYNTVESKV